MNQSVTELAAIPQRGGGLISFGSKTPGWIKWTGAPATEKSPRRRAAFQITSMVMSPARKAQKE